MSPLQSNDGSGKEVQQKHMKKVPLHLIFDAIESANDVYDQYLDTKEMNVIMLPNLNSDFAEIEDEDEELLERIENDEEHRYLALPSEFDIHEYAIMEDYINELDDNGLARRLAGAIRGRGAFRRFKNILIEQGKIQSWYDYRDQYYWDFARKWCIGKELEFIDDQKEYERN